MELKELKETYKLQETRNLIKTYELLNEEGESLLIEIWENSNGSYLAIPKPMSAKWTHTNTQNSVKEALNYILGMPELKEYFNF